MKISHYSLEKRHLPFQKVFRTAVRESYGVEEVVVRLETDTGKVGYGSAPANEKVTGESRASLAHAIELIVSHVKEVDVWEQEKLYFLIQNACRGNHGAKAAVDMALYHLRAKLAGQPLWRLLGAFRSRLETSLTLSLDRIEKMCQEAEQAVAQGFTSLKIKVDAQISLERLLKELRTTVGEKIQLRLDANQAWKSKEAIQKIRQVAKYQLEFVEQPVAAQDIAGLKKVCQQSEVPIVADEAVFSPWDAWQIIREQAADIINVKLMKCGGITPALRIIHLAETAGIECMVGCMMEGEISHYAACCVAASQRNVTKVDLDSIYFLKELPRFPGVVYQNNALVLT